MFAGDGTIADIAAEIDVVPVNLCDPGIGFLLGLCDSLAQSGDTQ